MQWNHWEWKENTRNNRNLGDRRKQVSCEKVNYSGESPRRICNGSWAEKREELESGDFGSVSGKCLLPNGWDWVETRNTTSSSAGGGWAKSLGGGQQSELGAGREISMTGKGLRWRTIVTCCYRFPIAPVTLPHMMRSTESSSDREDSFGDNAYAKRLKCSAPKPRQQHLYPQCCRHSLQVPSTQLSKGKRDQKATMGSLSDHGTILTST